MNRRDFLLSSALLAAATLPAAAATHNTLIFVHGAMHGAWCWYKMLPRLQTAGVNALALDLPGRGRNPLPREQHTRAAFVATILRAIDAAPGPVTLIGHDIGGLLISLAAEAQPERVARLVYLAAYFPANGDALLSLAQRDDESLATKRAVVSRDRASIALREDAVREVLYSDCNDEDVALAQLCLLPEATQPYSAPLELSAARFGRVPKASILCAQDRALGPRLQRAMSEAGGCERSITLDCGHAPFFAQPDNLTSALREAIAA